MGGYTNPKDSSGDWDSRNTGTAASAYGFCRACLCRYKHRHNQYRAVCPLRYTRTRQRIARSSDLDNRTWRRTMNHRFGTLTNSTLIPDVWQWWMIHDDVKATPFPMVVNDAPSANITATGTLIAANVPLTYAFTSTLDQYSRIFSGQCDRVGAFIYNKLLQLNPSDEDENEAIVDSIADVIDLVGEPASGTAVMEAH